MATQSPYHVVVADFITDDLEHERNVFGKLARVTATNAFSEQDLVGHVENCDAIMLFHNVALTEQTIGRLECCKLIARCGVGVDNVDLDAARARGIPVSNVPDYGTEEVADSAIGMALALTRGFSRMNSQLRDSEHDGVWAYEQAAPLFRLRGRTFGIVGFGRIGVATALRAKTLGMDVQFYDPLLPDGYDKMLGVRRVETIEELFATSLVVSLHCPSTPQTKGLVSHELIEQMQPGSYLVNTARGNVLDTSAIPPAIASGKLAGAAIDVLANEPPPVDDPLIAAWRDPSHPAHHRVIVNPHAAFYCEEGLIDMRVKAAKSCQRALLGEPLRNIVN